MRFPHLWAAHSRLDTLGTVIDADRPIEEILADLEQQPSHPII